jgi:hypothetical protein
MDCWNDTSRFVVHKTKSQNQVQKMNDFLVQLSPKENFVIEIIHII